MPSLNSAILDSAVVTPLAGIIHPGAALFEAASVAQKGTDRQGAGNVGVGSLGSSFAAFNEFYIQALILEEPLPVSDQLRQALEGRSGFKYELSSHNSVSSSQWDKLSVYRSIL